MIFAGANGRVGSCFEGFGDADFEVARLNPNGSLDTTFGFGGRATADFGAIDQAFAGALQSDGKIVIVGRTDGLDADFGKSGIVTSDFLGGSFDQGARVALQSDGKIVIAGDTFDFNGTTDEDFVVARYLADGTPDVSFAPQGFITTDIGAATSDDGTCVAIQTDGKILVVGTVSDFNTSRVDIAVTRYEP